MISIVSDCYFLHCSLKAVLHLCTAWDVLFICCVLHSRSNAEHSKFTRNCRINYRKIISFLDNLTSYFFSFSRSHHDTAPLQEMLDEVQVAVTFSMEPNGLWVPSIRPQWLIIPVSVQLLSIRTNKKFHTASKSCRYPNCLYLPHHSPTSTQPYALITMTFTTFLTRKIRVTDGWICNNRKTIY